MLDYQRVNIPLNKYHIDWHGLADKCLVLEIVLLMEEISNNHLGCIQNLVNSWDRLHINWCGISSINSMSWYDFLFLLNEKVPMFLRVDVEVFESSISVGPQKWGPGDPGISILGGWAPTVSKVVS